MPSVIPFIPSEAFYTFSTSIDEVQYIFDVRWNSRAGHWYYDLKDENGDVIRSGMRVALGAFPLHRSVDARAPTGALMAVDTTGQDLEATYDDMGVRVLMVYYTLAEIQEFLAS